MTGARQGVRRLNPAWPWVRIAVSVLALLAAVIFALGACAVERRSRFEAEFPVPPADPMPHSNIVLPFTMSGGHLLVQVSVNGVNVPALVDTGAPISGIDTAYLKERAIAVQKSSIVVNGQTAAKPVRLNLVVGGQTVSSVVATDLTVLRRSHAAPVILGVRDLMDNRVLEIDFQAKTLTLHRRSTFVPPAGTHQLPITARGSISRRYGVPVRIGDEAVLAMVDLGAEHALAISAAVARKADIETKGADKAFSRGINRRRESHVVEGSFSVGPYEFSHLQVKVSTRGTPAKSWDAVLGTGAIRHLHFWMDVTGGRLWLMRPPRFILGLADSADGITVVNPGGPAEAAGLKVGDRISSIDGVPRGDSWGTRDWTSADPVTLTMEDGRVLTITPYDMFQ